MIDRRLWPALVAAGVAVVLGLVAVVDDIPALTMIVALCAPVAAAVAVTLSRSTDQLASRTVALADRVGQLEGELVRTRMELADATRPADAVEPVLEVHAPEWHPAQETFRPRVGDGVSDADSGLFNEAFFRATLDKRVSAARRGLRPIAVALVEVITGARDGQPVPAPARLLSSMLLGTLREADTACRLDDGRFALILEDTPENGAVWTIERVRRSLAADHPEHTMRAGVACYPAHAFDAAEIFDQAQLALLSAREWHQDRIEVATLRD